MQLLTLVGESISRHRVIPCVPRAGCNAALAVPACSTTGARQKALGDLRPLGPDRCVRMRPRPEPQWFPASTIPADDLRRRFKTARAGWLRPRYLPELHAEGAMERDLALRLGDASARRALRREVVAAMEDPPRRHPSVRPLSGLRGEGRRAPGTLRGRRGSAEEAARRSEDAPPEAQGRVSDPEGHRLWCRRREADPRSGERAPTAGRALGRPARDPGADGPRALGASYSPGHPRCLEALAARAGASRVATR